MLQRLPFISLSRRGLTFLLLFFSFCLVAQINVTTDQNDAYYEVGQTATFNITSQQSGQLNYTLKYDNFADPIQTGTLNINPGQTLTLTHTASEAGIVICTVTMNDNNAVTAASFSPYEIEAFEDEPADFDAFWNTQKNILAGVPIDAQVTWHSSTPYSTTYRVNLGNINNRRVYGYISIPNGPGPFPAVITFPAFGDVANTAAPENHMAENVNVISMSVSIHNVEPDEIDPNAYEPDNYVDKDGLYYKNAIMGGVRAIDYIFSRPDFDGQNLGTTGVSQGAGLSTIIAGLDNRVNFLMHSNPVLSQNTGMKYGRATGFPNYIQRSRNEVGTASHEAQTIEAVKYYDAIYFAKRYEGPSLTLISYEDVVTPAATSFGVFNALKGPKFLVHSLNLGHAHPSEFWVGRLDFMRRFVPGTTNPPFPFASSDKGYFIDAGDNVSIQNNAPVNLSGTVERNGTVNPNYQLRWEKVEGPGNVNFSNSNSYNTTATFSANGEYVVRLVADDYSNNLTGEQKYFTLMDDVKVTIGGGGGPTTGCNNPSNVAIGKVATQSSTQQDGAASRAVDGNTDGTFWNGHVSLTNWENQPWWEVDLGSVHEISYMKIWNRTDCCADILKDYYVFVSDEPFSNNNANATQNQQGVHSFYQSDQAGLPSNIDIEKTGRYVRIQLKNQGFLGLAEIEIIGCEQGNTSLLPQTITFDAISNKLTTDNPFAINASTNSGLAVSFEIESGPAYVNNNTVTLTGDPGTVTIRAVQNGNGQYEPAPIVTQTFEVTAPTSGGCFEPSNLALNGTATQSGTQLNASASRANDGNTAGDFWQTQSVSLTNWTNQAWWEIDLGAVGTIKAINIWNRTDCCSDILKDYYVFVSEEPFSSTDLNETQNQNGVQSFYQSGEAQLPTTISMDGKGRYVRVQLQGQGFLAMAEVEVIGCTQGGGTGSTQSITFAEISNKLTTDNPFEISASASSGLPVFFEFVSGPAFLQNGSTVVLTGNPGTVTIKATQAGNGQYSAAPEIIRSFDVVESQTGGCNNTQNIGLNSNTTQSGTQSGGDASRAVDGNTDGSFWGGNSVTITNWQSNAWWESDLGGMANIESINIWNRTDCCQEFLSDVYVFVSEVPFVSQDLNETLNQPGVSSYFIDGVVGAPSEVMVNRSGRYVRVQLEGAAFLSLAEVEIMGCFPVTPLEQKGSNEIEAEKFNLSNNLVIYPNPTNDVVQVRLKSLFFKEQLLIQILNSNGVIVKKRVVTETSLENLRFNVSELSEGVHFIKVKSDGKRQAIFPFVIVRQ